MVGGISSKAKLRSRVGLTLINKSTLRGAFLCLLCLWDWHSHINKVGAPGREISQTDHAVKSKQARLASGLLAPARTSGRTALMERSGISIVGHYERKEY